MPEVTFGEWLQQPPRGFVRWLIRSRERSDGTTARDATCGHCDWRLFWFDAPDADNAAAVEQRARLHYTEAHDA